jgi:hypothetical protein
MKTRSVLFAALGAFLLSAAAPAFADPHGGGWHGGRGWHGGGWHGDRWAYRGYRGWYGGPYAYGPRVYYAPPAPYYSYYPYYYRPGVTFGVTIP